VTNDDDAGISFKLLVLKTRQVDKLRAFYQTLDISFTEEQHGKGPVHSAGQVAGVLFEIYPLPDEAGAVDQMTRLGFAVKKLEQVVESLRTSGAPVTGPPQKTAWGYRAVVQDPDGRAVELYEN
jgi:lactoylglutathione lyase